MINRFGKLTLMTLLAASALGLPARVLAQTGTNSPAKTKTTAATPKPGAFTGKLAAVDLVAKTITLEEKSKPGRTFQITSQTRIMKNGKPGITDDAVLGEGVSGTFTSGADGKLVASTINFTVKTAPAKSTTPPGSPAAKGGGS